LIAKAEQRSFHPSAPASTISTGSGTISSAFPILFGIIHVPFDSFISQNEGNAEGIDSIHYFVKEANQKLPIFDYKSENWEKCRSFIEDSGYQAFSDYPTRVFFRELFAEYPDSYFILTVRKCTEVWLQSMRSFFSDQNLDYDYLRGYTPFTS
jgi:hypothetical protein